MRWISGLLIILLCAILAPGLNAQPTNPQPPGGIATAQPWTFQYNTTFSAGTTVTMNGIWAGTNSPVTLSGNNTWTGTNSFTGPSLTLSNVTLANNISGGGFNAVTFASYSGVATVPTNVTFGSAVTGDPGAARLAVMGSGELRWSGGQGGDEDAKLRRRTASVLTFFTNVTNRGIVIEAIPTGTPASGAVRGDFRVANTDLIADAVNTETLDVLSVGTGYNLQVAQSGTGSLRAFSMLMGGTQLLQMTTNPALVLGQPSLATTATTGYPYISAIAGTPTGVPNAITGAAALVVDTTNSRLDFYSGGWQTLFPVLAGTTGSIGGGALVAGACASGTATITGATTSMVAVADPNTYPGDGAVWDAQVTSADTVTVKVCAIVALTPAASTYNVRVIQ